MFCEYRDGPTTRVIPPKEDADFLAITHLFITYIGAFLVCPVSTNLGGFLFNLKTRIFQTYDHIAFPKKWVNRLKVDFELCHR